MAVCESEYQNKLQCLLKELQKNPQAIFNLSLLGPVVIQNCNGTGAWPFTHATLEYNLEPAFPLSCCFQSGTEYIIKSLEEEQVTNEPMKNAFERLLKFLNEEQHRHCLLWLKDTSNKAEIQALLAHHLFAPLVHPGSYIIDNKYFPLALRKCPSCNEDLHFGNTSFGNANIWHGNADIMVQRSVVKIDAGPAAAEDETEVIAQSEDGDHSSDDGDLSEDNVDETNNLVLAKRQALVQAFAQTIVNTFCQVKKSGNLSSSFIPSFLATRNAITINMYGCEQDRLLSTQPLPIRNITMGCCSDSINISTVISVWLALNFESFDDGLRLCFQESFKNCFPVSNFKHIVDAKLSVYTDHVLSPLEDRIAQKQDVPMFHLSPECFQSEVTKRITDLMKLVQTQGK